MTIETQDWKHNIDSVIGIGSLVSKVTHSLKTGELQWELHFWDPERTVSQNRWSLNADGLKDRSDCI